ncbi:MAG: cell division protein FtsH, partial [Actinomycetota bacterium]|nr:cell division protein FtsH [Actinomycetota bacterium]
MSRFFKGAAFPILIVVVLAFFAHRLISPSDEETRPTFDDFQTQLAAGELESVEVRDRDNKIVVTPRPAEPGTEPEEYEVGFTEAYGDQLLNDLSKSRSENLISTFNVEGDGESPWGALIWVLPIVFFIGFWFFLMNQMQGGGSKVMQFGKSKAKRLSVDSPKI